MDERPRPPGREHSGSLRAITARQLQALVRQPVLDAQSIPNCHWIVRIVSLSTTKFSLVLALGPRPRVFPDSLARPLFSTLLPIRSSCSSGQVSPVPCPATSTSPYLRTRSGLCHAI